MATTVRKGIIVGMENEFCDKELKLITLEQYSKLSADLGDKVIATGRVRVGQVISSWLGNDQNSIRDKSNGAASLLFGTIFAQIRENTQMRLIRRILRRVLSNINVAAHNSEERISTISLSKISISNRNYPTTDSQILNSCLPDLKDTQKPKHYFSAKDDTPS